MIQVVKRKGAQKICLKRGKRDGARRTKLSHRSCDRQLPQPFYWHGIILAWRWSGMFFPKGWLTTHRALRYQNKTPQYEPFQNSNLMSLVACQLKSLFDGRYILAMFGYADWIQWMDTIDVHSDLICRKNQITYGMLKVSEKMSLIIHVSVVVSPGRIIRQY
jgi:hypothetical protein